MNKVFLADAELKRVAGKDIKYFVMYANETKMKVFTNKRDAESFARKVSQEGKSKKRFLAYWGKGYTKQGSRVVSEEFFSKANGYDPQDSYNIKTMAVGRKVDLSDLSGTHTVKRVK